MMTPDLINGAFELVGSAAAWLNVRRLYRDKRCAGFSRLSAVFFTSWSAWNLYYYPHLDQWALLVGAAALLAGNLTWVGLMIYYARRREGRALRTI